MKPVQNSAHIDRDGSGILKTEGKIGGAAMTAYCAYAVPLTAVTVATLTFVPPSIPRRWVCRWRWSAPSCSRCA